MRELKIEELAHVSGAGLVICPPPPCYTPCPPPPCYEPPECPEEPKPKKGNNGWGNGGDDGTNNGSDKGAQAQADSKFADEDR